MCKECTYCGDELDLEEIESPYTDDDNEIMCDDCYDENYRTFCPICENSYDTKDFVNDYIVITEELSKETEMIAGIYEIKKRPFFYGSILSGFDNFFDNSIELVTSININQYKKIDCGESCCKVTSDFICPDCVNNYVRKDNFLKSNGFPAILFKRYEGKYFKDYSSEQLHLIRQNLIHKRINCRGIIEMGNKF